MTVAKLAKNPSPPSIKVIVLVRRIDLLNSRRT